MVEEAKQIVKNYPLYSVDCKGNVFNNKSGKRLAPKLDKDGYSTVVLYNRNGKKTKKVHRLVAEAFVPNPLRKPEVNHKNMVRNDNRVENLEWATCLENQRYKWESGYRPGPSKRRIKTMCLENKEIFNSQMEAAERAGVKQGSISSAISRGCKAGGFHWRALHG